MQFNALNLIKNYIIFIYMQCNVHNVILICTTFIYMQFNALLINCLLFFIPFNPYNYIYHVRLYMYCSAFMAAKHNKTFTITGCSCLSYFPQCVI